MSAVDQTLLQSINKSLSAISNSLSGSVFGLINAPTNATLTSKSSGNVANATATATLAAIVGQTNYLSGFDITSSGATAASIVIATVSGLSGGTLSYIYANVAGATTANTPLSIRFPVAIPAAATNTAITVSLPALGAGNTNAAVTIYGYHF